MRRASLAIALAMQVRASFAVLRDNLPNLTRPDAQRLAGEEARRLPRNRAEARRLNATRGFVARGAGGATPSPLLRLHRRIERERDRQTERFLQGRYAW